MSLSKYLIIGTGALAVLGAGIYWLSQETEETTLDPKVHTKDKLHEILNELFLEYASGYLAHYHIL